MRIAIIHHQYAKKGGMETYLFDLLKGFNQSGDKVDVITYRVDKNIALQSAELCTIKKHKIFLPGMWRKFGFMYYINKYFDKNKYDLSLSLMRTASQDVIICGGTHRGYLKYLHKKPTLKDKIETYFEYKSYINSPYIVAHSSMLKDEINQLYSINLAKIHLLYPPLNTAVFNRGVRQRRDEHIKNFALNSNKIKLLFPSTGHARKGWHELAGAMRKLPQDKFELIIAGSKIFENNAAELTNVRSLGYVHNMAELYAAVDFTILPSHYEPYGLVVAESLQCGTPVIISDKVGAKDFVTEASGIIFNEVKPEIIAEAILEAAERRNEFHIPEKFAETYGLTLQEHINKLKLLCD